MTILARFAGFLLFAVAAASAPLAHAQSTESAAAPPYSSEDGAFTEADLDQMLAPVALYPDELLSQIFMASTYPLEVVEAARWASAHPGLVGQDAVAAADDQDWDPSVKSLVAFPDVLAMMNDRLEWTQRLGEAFLGQQGDVMLSVQKLRHAAYDEGNLASSDEMVVTREGNDFALDSPSPERMYVPYYDPRVVYGDWWWPEEQPIYWDPWPGYYVGGYGFGWGVAVPLGINFFFGDFDWHHHHVRISDHHPFYFHGHDHRPIAVHNNTWRYDPHHRHGVAYQNPLVRRDFGTNRNRGRTPTDTRTNPMARTPTQQRASNPVTRGPTRQQAQGFFPAAPQPQQRTAVPNGGTGGFFPQQPVVRQPIARPPATVPQHAQQPVYAQPLARPHVNAVPQAPQQAGHPQGLPVHVPAPAPAPAHASGGAPHGNAPAEASPSQPLARGR